MSSSTPDFRFEICSALVSSWLKKIRMPPDTFERHTLVATLAESPSSMLDVGGIKGELAIFLPETEITTINIEGEDADAHFDGDRLPFADGEFEVAVSLDVLEHIPAQDRALHFRELARVARRKVIVCCPLGTPEHVEAERTISAWHEDYTGRDHRFLSEHLENGLPTEAELESLAGSCNGSYRIRYHGDFRRANNVFQSSVRLRQQPNPKHVASYLRNKLDPRRDSQLEETSKPFTNRAFVEVDLIDSLAVA